METDLFSRKIADMDNADKPREKALNYGISHLTNAELMAILLRTGIKGLSVLDLSRDILLSGDNKLSNLARMTVNELCTKFKGLGPAKAITLLAAIELGSRCSNSFAFEQERPRIRSSKDVFDLMIHELQRIEHEEFWVIFMNNAGKVQSKTRVSIGGVASTVVDVRIIMKMAIDRLSTGIILVHNHPSGTVKPSVQDDNITRKIKESCTFLDLKLLDHVIVTPNSFYSYNDEGRL